MRPSQPNIIPTEQFLLSFGKSLRDGMDLSLYYGNNYRCACGELHTIEFYTKILCHGFWRLMVVCPIDPSTITHVKVRMFLMVKFLGFQSINGTHLQSTHDHSLMGFFLAHLDARR
jgi:hypothetical protein